MPWAAFPKAIADLSSTTSAKSSGSRRSDCAGLPESTAARFGAWVRKASSSASALMKPDWRGVGPSVAAADATANAASQPPTFRRSGLEDPRIINAIVLGHPLESLRLDSQDYRCLRNVPLSLCKYPKNIGLLHFFQCWRSPGKNHWLRAGSGPKGHV